MKTKKTATLAMATYNITPSYDILFFNLPLLSERSAPNCVESIDVCVYKQAFFCLGINAEEKM